MLSEPKDTLCFAYFLEHFNKGEHLIANTLHRKFSGAISTDDLTIIYQALFPKLSTDEKVRRFAELRVATAFLTITTDLAALNDKATQTRWVERMKLWVEDLEAQLREKETVA